MIKPKPNSTKLRLVFFNLTERTRFPVFIKRAGKLFSVASMVVSLVVLFWPATAGIFPKVLLGMGITLAAISGLLVLFFAGYYGVFMRRYRKLLQPVPGIYTYIGEDLMETHLTFFCRCAFGRAECLPKVSARPANVNGDGHLATSVENPPRWLVENKREWVFNHPGRYPE